MKCFSWIAARGSASRRSRWLRPWVERLEDRNAAGSLLGLLGSSFPAPVAAGPNESAQDTDVALIGAAAPGDPQRDETPSPLSPDVSVSSSPSTAVDDGTESPEAAVRAGQPDNLDSTLREPVGSIAPLDDFFSGPSLGLPPSGDGAGFGASVASGTQADSGPAAAPMTGPTAAPLPPQGIALGVVPIGQNPGNVAGLLVAASSPELPNPSSVSPAPSSPTVQPRALEAFGRLPVFFEVNQGQADAGVQYLARGNGYTLFLTSDAATLVATNASQPDAGATAASMQIVGANPNVQATGQDLLPGISNYFIGNNPSEWHTHIAHYGQVEYQNIYQGIDLVYHGGNGGLEYDFVVAPGASANVINLGFQGADGLSVDTHGDLVIHTGMSGSLVERAPLLYQNVDGIQTRVAGQFVLGSNNQVGFTVGAYDHSRPLVIDPTISYSTYLGGSGTEAGAAIAVDSAGNAYVTGSTNSVDFVAGQQNPIAGGSDVFVAKLKPDGSGLVYLTTFGGSQDEGGFGIAVDSAGNAYVTGSTASRDFPTDTANSFQRKFGGGSDDAFVTELSADGRSLLYSTFLGGSGDDGGGSIALDSTGMIYVTGFTTSGRPGTTNFPISAGAYQTTLNNGQSAFVAKLDPSQDEEKSRLYSTYLGGMSGVDSGRGIAVDPKNFVYVTGEANDTQFPIKAVDPTAGVLRPQNPGGIDAFVAKLDPSKSGDDSLVYSTYLGGTNFDTAFGIAVDSAGDAYVTGVTLSSDFKIAGNAYQSAKYGYPSDAFISKLNPTATELLYSSYLGGTLGDGGQGIAIDNAGNAYVTGFTGSSDDFNLTTDATQPVYGGSSDDAFVAKLPTVSDPTVSDPPFVTYLGGSGDDQGRGIAFQSGSAYATGETSSSDFPPTPGVYGSYRGNTDGFVTRYTF